MAAFIAAGLEAEGYSLDVAYDGVSGRALALSKELSLVILDVLLPDLDGFAVLRSIRKVKPDLPVILLTARADVASRVEGLDLGADDYMSKPFSLEELLARVRVRLRGPGQSQSAVLRVGDLAVDLRTRRVTKGTREVALTPREYALLIHLMRHPDYVLSREQLLQAVWGLDLDPGTKVVDVYIGYLRRKLHGDSCPGGSPRRHNAEASGGVHSPDTDEVITSSIETVRHVGYRLRALRG